MIRINITTNNTRKTKSFLNVKELAHYIFYNCHSIFADDVAKEIWDLNVGKSLIENGFRFSIQSKQRSGNILMNGK
jgi:hypothetical protein